MFFIKFEPVIAKRSQRFYSWVLKHFYPMPLRHFIYPYLPIFVHCGSICLPVFRSHEISGEPPNIVWSKIVSFEGTLVLIIRKFNKKNDLRTIYLIYLALAHGLFLCIADLKFSDEICMLFKKDVLVPMEQRDRDCTMMRFYYVIPLAVAEVPGVNRGPWFMFSVYKRWLIDFI